MLLNFIYLIIISLLIGFCKVKGLHVIILYILKNKRKYKGQITYTYLALYGLIRAFIEGLRTDSLMIGNFRISQVLSTILFVGFGSIIIIKNIKKDYENEK